MLVNTKLRNLARSARLRSRGPRLSALAQFWSVLPGVTAPGYELRPQQLLVRALAHPLLVRLNIERSIFAAQLFQEGQACFGLRC